MNVECFVLGYIQNNVYLVTQGNNCIVIDPTFDPQDVIANTIKSRGLTLQAILLTHGHFDHCGGANSLSNKFGAPVYCRKEDEALCNNASRNRWNAPSDDCFPTKFYSEGINKIADFDVEVIFCSGHTEGGVCLIMDSYLFSGDTLFRGSIGRTDLEGGDSHKLNLSLQKLASLDTDYKVLPGHGEMTTLSHEKMHNIYMKGLCK